MLRGVQGKGTEGREVGLVQMAERRVRRRLGTLASLPWSPGGLGLRPGAS